MRATAAAILTLVMVAACTGTRPTRWLRLRARRWHRRPPVAAEPRIYLNLMWHQHQPLYPKDFDGVVPGPGSASMPPRTTGTWRRWSGSSPNCR